MKTISENNHLRNFIASGYINMLKVSLIFFITFVIVNYPISLAITSIPVVINAIIMLVLLQ